MVDRGWRIFATGLCFTVFGIGGVLASLTYFPLLRLLAWNKAAARRHIADAMQMTMRVFVELMRGLGLLTYEIRGRERLQKPGQLVVANHPTLIDVVFLIAFTPRAGCIVKQGLWRNPLLRWPVSWAGYIPNKTATGGAELIERCVACLRGGRSLIVFPEGTRTVPGRPLQLKRGAAQVALAAGADVLPVTIVCEPLTLSKGEPWYRVPPRRPHFTISAGETVPPSAYKGESALPSVAARHLTAWLASHFARGSL